MSHGRWQKSPQWGPSAQNRARFVRKYDNGASVFEPKYRAEPEIEPRGTIGASIQSSKKDRRAAERPHCAIFCHTRPSMPQQTSQNTITSQGGRLSRRPMVHDPWITGHDPTIQQSHGSIGHHSPTVLQHKGPSSILPHKLRHKPKPDLTHQPGLPGTKSISQTQKSHPVGWLLKFRWCRRRDLNPHARYVGTSTSS